MGSEPARRMEFVAPDGGRLIPVAHATAPLIGALIDMLPPGGASWPHNKRAAWFELMWKACEVVYADDGEVIEMPSFLSAASSPRVAEAPAPRVPPAAAAPASQPQPKALPPFYIDRNGVARRGSDGAPVMPGDVGTTPIVDLRGEAGDLGAIAWADGSTGVRGFQLEITTSD